MTFSQMNLAIQTFANGFTHWHYRARERYMVPGSQFIEGPPVAAEGPWHTIEEVLAPGYFDAAAGTLTRGDYITCQCADQSVMTVRVRGEHGVRTRAGEAIELDVFPSSVLRQEKAA